MGISCPWGLWNHLNFYDKKDKKSHQHIYPFTTDHPIGQTLWVDITTPSASINGSIIDPIGIGRTYRLIMLADPVSCLRSKNPLLTVVLFTYRYIKRFSHQEFSCITPAHPGTCCRVQMVQWSTTLLVRAPLLVRGSPPPCNWVVHDLRQLQL